MATKKNADAANPNLQVSDDKNPVQKTVKKATVKKAAAKGEKKEKTPLAKTASKISKTEKKVSVANIPAAIKSIAPKKSPKKDKDTINVTFEIRFSTEFGQQIFIVGNHQLLGNDDINKAASMQYFNEKAWNISLDFNAKDIPQTISYRYFVKNADGSIVEEGVANKNIDITASAGKKIYVSDFWSFSGFPVGLFETKPFKVLLNKESDVKKVRNATHVFTIKAPAVKNNQVVCMLGADKKLGAWEVKKALPLYSLGNGNWQIELDLSKSVFPLEYKFGLWDTKLDKLVTLEAYEDRVCNIEPEKNAKVFVNEGLINLQENA